MINATFYVIEYNIYKITFKYITWNENFSPKVMKKGNEILSNIVYEIKCRDCLGKYVGADHNISTIGLSSTNMLNVINKKQVTAMVSHSVHMGENSYILFC